MFFISPHKLFFGHVAKWLNYKDQVNFKFYDVTAWLTNNCKHILPNISRNKSNQTIKFGQLIEYNRDMFLLKNNAQNVVEKFVPDPFFKNWNWVYLWIKSFIVCFYCMPSWGLSKYIETKLQVACFYFILSFFLNKKMSGTSLLPSFSV